MVTDDLLRTAAIPGLNLATTAPAFAAYQAATNNLINASSTNPGFVHTDVIQNGLGYLQYHTPSTDPVVAQSLKDASDAALNLDKQYSAQNIEALSMALKKLHGQNAVASFINQLYSNQPGSNNNLPPHTRIARLDPAKGVLYI